MEPNTGYSGFHLSMYFNGGGMLGVSSISIAFGE